MDQDGCCGHKMSLLGQPWIPGWRVKRREGRRTPIRYGYRRREKVVGKGVEAIGRRRGYLAPKFRCAGRGISRATHSLGPHKHSNRKITFAVENFHGLPLHSFPSVGAHIWDLTTGPPSSLATLHLAATDYQDICTDGSQKMANYSTTPRWTVSPFSQRVPNQQPSSACRTLEYMILKVCRYIARPERHIPGA